MRNKLRCLLVHQSFLLSSVLHVLESLLSCVSMPHMFSDVLITMTNCCQWSASFHLCGVFSLFVSYVFYANHRLSGRYSFLQCDLDMAQHGDHQSRCRPLRPSLLLSPRESLAMLIILGWRAPHHDHDRVTVFLDKVLQLLSNHDNPSNDGANEGGNRSLPKVDVRCGYGLRTVTLELWRCWSASFGYCLHCRSLRSWFVLSNLLRLLDGEDAVDDLQESL